jgi:hypothetical protein
MTLRHCECVYYQAWHRTTPIRPGKDVLPNVAPGTRLPSKAEEEAMKAASASSSTLRAPGLAVLPSSRSQPQSQLGARAGSTTMAGTGLSQETIEEQQQALPQAKRGLPFDEECKLVYGVLFSLRSMVKKLSNKE